MNEYRRSQRLLAPGTGRWILLGAILAVAALGIAAERASAIVVCNPGEWKDPITHVCMPAPPGHYADGSNKYLCAAGTYQPLSGQSKCWPADIGYFVQNPGSIYQYECPIGSYQPSPRKSFCLAAAQGWYVPMPAAYEQLPCPVGTYQDQEGQSSCKPAPAGHYVATIKSKEPTPCQPGSYQDQEGQDSCKLAPVDTYVDTAGATEPTDCPPGTSNPTEGAKTASACVAPPTEKPTAAATESDKQASETPTPKPVSDHPTSGESQKPGDAVPISLIYVLSILIALGLGGVIWFIIKRFM